MMEDLEELAERYPHDPAVRIRRNYREHNLYIIVAYNAETGIPVSVDMSMTDIDDSRTLEGLDAIANLSTKLLERKFCHDVLSALEGVSRSERGIARLVFDAILFVAKEKGHVQYPKKEEGADGAGEKT